MKLIHFCIFLILVVGTSIPVSGTPKQANDSVSQNLEAPDTTGQLSDTLKLKKDSLQKLVPYLDDVEADSKNKLLVLYMLAIILATFMSEDLACIGAGLMAAQGIIDFWPAAIAATAGIFIGDFTLYFAGRLMGNGIFNIPPFKWMVKKENVYSAEAWFEKKGPVILVLSRFIPGSRFPVYLSAGILKTGFWTFLLYFGLTALLWTPTFVWLSVFAGNELLLFYEAYEEYAVWAALAVFIFILVLLKYLVPEMKKKFGV
ncbi:DedA family protein [Gracilimonas sediminicola]|uniref:DedA family protein n=1 Tax=Gracilimonas sediminicola TaxID=2952158 RepID=A0A9X2L5F2_9BACT|nr:DedA family protein [Gracilimonas sediminicola]